MSETEHKDISEMAHLPTNFTTSYPVSPQLSPSVSEEDIPPQQVTQTVSHPYVQVRMRKKPIAEPVMENGSTSDNQSNIEMFSLKAELENAKTELNRRTVMFSNHYTSMVEKWKNEKNKREVAETVAVEKARDNMVLQRTHFSLKQRANKTSVGTPESPATEEESKTPVNEERELIGLTEENQKLTLEIQDLKETVKMLENQISEFKLDSEEQNADLQELRAKLTEMELELKQSKSYMLSAQQQYRNLAGRLQNEKGKREIAETVAVNKARELEVQKRTSVMVMSSLSQSICIESTSPTGLIQNSIDTLDYATKISSLETEVEDLKESRIALESALTKYEQECNIKDEEIRQLRERVFISSMSLPPNENSIAVTQSVAMQRPYGGNNDIMGRLSTETVSPLLLQSSSTEYSSLGPGMFHRGSVIGGTLDRPRNKKLSGVQSKEQLQQELKSKEALINIMKEKLERMKIHGSREDPELEVERKELEDQVGGLDRKLSSIKDKGSETEVDELREKLENVEKRAADFEEKNRYYQELLNKMNRTSDYQSSPKLSPPTETPSPINIPPPPPNLPPAPPPPLPEGLFGPATPQLVTLPQGKRSSRAAKSDNRVEAMNELMSMLSSGKVHLKRARSKVPTPRDDPPPLIIPHALLRRQITAPNTHENLQASIEIASKETSLTTGTIDERLRLSRLQRGSSEHGGGSELFKKLNKRYKHSEEFTEQNDNVQIPIIDSNPLPPLITANSDNKPKPTARRKNTPVPSNSPSGSPILSRKEDIASIPEEQEPPSSTEQSISPIKQVSPFVSPNKPKFLSPLMRQSSTETAKDRHSKPFGKTPLLPPATREMVPISAKPKPELRREKSGSTPAAPIPVKPSKLMGIFKKEGKSNSTETPPHIQTPRYARAATEGDIDCENIGTENPTQNQQKVKIQQTFAKN